MPVGSVPAREFLVWLLVHPAAHPPGKTGIVSFAPGSTERGLENSGAPEQRAMEPVRPDPALVPDRLRVVPELWFSPQTVPRRL